MELIRYKRQELKKGGSAFQVVLWGWGRDYFRNLNTILYLQASGQIEAAGVTGNRLPPCRRLDGIPVVSPSEAVRMSPDYVIIMHELSEKEIVAEALEAGFTREQLIPCRVLSVPYFVFEDYIRLRRRKLSILSNDCWGGFISSTLGLEHRSPFKNLWVLDEDYLKCLEDSDHYLRKAEPVFSRWAKGNPEDSYAEYPVLLLDDVELYCNHDRDPDAAIEKWMQRREKLNMDDVFAEMRTARKESELRFNGLSAYPNKICFVPYETEEAGSFQVPAVEGEASWVEVLHRNARFSRCNFLFSIMGLLSGDRSILRAEM